MSTDKVVIKNIKNLADLEIDFDFGKSRIITVTGRNGVGKTSVVKAFRLISDPQVFQKTAGLNSVRSNSSVYFEISGFQPFEYKFNEKFDTLDTRDKIPSHIEISAELPIPYGNRFEYFSLISNYDGEIRANIASSQYSEATELILFLSKVYSSDKFKGLNSTKVNKYDFYFILGENDFYIREDHFSSGEFFLIQIYRLVTSGAKLIIIDELDISLDAAAQANLYSSLLMLVEKYESRLIVISHSLAFMSTVSEGGLYYLENRSGNILLENRSFGYIKSDLYGFSGRDRYILTEDEVLSGFLEYLIRKHIKTFFKYEIIPIGGQPQIDAISKRNDSHKIFGVPEKVVIVIDKDIEDKIKYSGPSKVIVSPVDDIELYIWKNRFELLPNIKQPLFKSANKDKDTSKTYWKKIIRSKQVSANDLYNIVEENFGDKTQELINGLSDHLCLS